MPFLNNNKFKEIKTAATNGDEKAAMVLQALRKGSQEDVDRLVGDYYAIPQTETEVPVQNEVQPENDAPEILDPAPQAEEQVAPVESVPEVEDLTEVLDTETDGLLDENEIDGIDFSTFLSNKRRDSNRATKNADYFKAFNRDSVANYVNSKKEAYKSKFGDSLHDIEHQCDDYDKSIDKYSQGVNDMLDDEQEFDNRHLDAYNDIMDNNGIMHSFGRHWDEADTAHVIDDLKGLVKKYGKKNVLAALNILKTDNNNFKNYRLGQINEEVERYNKSLDKLFN